MNSTTPTSASALKRTYEVMNIPHGELEQGMVEIGGGGAAAGGYWPAYMFGNGELGEDIVPSLPGIPIAGGGAGVGGRAHAANEYVCDRRRRQGLRMAGAEKAVATVMYAFAGKIRARAREAGDRRRTRPLTLRMIAVHELAKQYHVGDHVVHALRGVTMSVAPAEFVTIVGPSGSGKSTFMHILGCLDRPTTGRYVLNGRDVSTLPADELARVRNETIGFVFQGFNLLARTSALENVELPLLYTRKGVVKANERRDRALAALEAVGLTDRAEHHPNQLSGGQQQRVAIARALVTQPSLLLADEPTGNLDTSTSHEVMEIFANLCAKRGITIVVITHERDIAAYGTRTVDFRDGLIVSRSRQPIRLAFRPLRERNARSGWDDLT